VGTTARSAVTSPGYARQADVMGRYHRRGRGGRHSELEQRARAPPPPVQAIPSPWGRGAGKTAGEVGTGRVEIRIEAGPGLA